MNTSEKFLRFAAECEFMAEYTHISRTKLYGVRWLRGGYIALNCLIANAPRHTTVVPQSNIENPFTAGLTIAWRSRGQKWNGSRGSWQTW